MAGSVIVPHQWHDWIPATLKIGFKRFFCSAKDAYQLIINDANKAPWVLGIQPDRVMMQNLARRYASVQLVTILSKRELIVQAAELAQQWPSWSRIQLQWYDHSVCSPLDGRNQALLTFKEFVAHVYRLWCQNQHALFYCHCMAGRARSFLFTLALLLFYSDQIDHELKNTAPNLAELATFIRQRRSLVLGLQGLEGEQKGFAGLLALDWLVNQPLTWWQQRDPQRLQLDLQCAGMALGAILDNTYRTASDLEYQRRNAIKLMLLAKQMQITDEALQLLLWTPPWHVLESPVFQMPIMKLRCLKQRSWRHLPLVARTNWQRWQYWWITAHCVSY